MSTLIDEITLAYEKLRRHEGDLAIAQSQIRVGRKRITAARAQLDALLDELKNGQTRLPLFDRPEPEPEPKPEAAPKATRKTKGP
jgi:outer membrane protein TolC